MGNMLCLEDSNKKLKEYEELGSHLECQVCLEIPLDDKGIESCQNGHVVCNSCQDQIKVKNDMAFKCPSCRQKWTPCKNPIATSFLEVKFRNVKVKCKHEGCEVLCP